MKKILFVCSGNTCRSPMAEGVARKVFSDRSKTPVDVMSAGSSTVDGLPPSAHAVEVASRHNIDISYHQSRALNREMIRDADLIVTMGAKHRDTVSLMEPEATAYTVLLGSFCGRGDVSDPIGGDIGDYERTFGLIYECVVTMADRLDDFVGWKTGGER